MIAKGETPDFLTGKLEEHLQFLNDARKKIKEAKKENTQKLFDEAPASGFGFDEVVTLIKQHGSKTLTHTYAAPDDSKYPDLDLQITFRVKKAPVEREASGEGENKSKPEAESQEEKAA